MFTKNSVSQSMIDAVQSVLAEDKKLLLEPGKKKEDVPFDGPYKKPDTKPGHGDASRVKHLAKMAIPKKEVKEELKGNQHELDKNRNGKLDKKDFELLRMKKEDVELDEANTESKKEFLARQARLAAASAETAKDPARLKRMMNIPGYAAAMGLAKKTTKEEVEQADEATALERLKGVGGPRAAQNLPMGHAGKVTMKHVDASNASPQVKAMKASVVEQSPDKLLARTGMNMAHKFPRAGQTNTRNIPAINLPGNSPETDAYAEKRRAERAKELKPAIKSALGTHGPKGKLPEEVEELDELSKSTLGSYAKRASRDATITRKIAADFENQGKKARSPGMKAASDEISQKYKEKSWKRRDNVDKVIDRLTKEEVEQLEEGGINDLPNRGMGGTDTKGHYGVYRNSGPGDTKLKIVSKHKTLDSALRHIDNLTKKSGKNDHYYGHLSSHQPEQGKIPNHFHEEVELDEAINDNMHPTGVALLKHIKPEHHNLYKPHLTTDVFNGSFKDRHNVLSAAKQAGHLREDIGAMQSVVGENKGKKPIRVDTLKGPTISNDPEVRIANAHFSGKSATLKAEGKGTDTAVPFVTDSATHREINKAVRPTFKKIKEMLGKTGTSEEKNEK